MFARPRPTMYMYFYTTQQTRFLLLTLNKGYFKQRKFAAFVSLLAIASPSQYQGDVSFLMSSGTPPKVLPSLTVSVKFYTQMLMNAAHFQFLSLFSFFFRLYVFCLAFSVCRTPLFLNVFFFIHFLYMHFSWPLSFTVPLFDFFLYHLSLFLSECYGMWSLHPSSQRAPLNTCSCQFTSPVNSHC